MTAMPNPSTNGKPASGNATIEHSGAVGQRLDSDPTISLCLIAKDEEEFIERCIKSVDGLCSQVVVVDTGSTDRTVEIAEACGAEVHFFDWTGSFAEARNKSVEYATGDWIMVMDVDGELAYESRRAVLDAVRDSCYPTTFCGKSLNYLGDGNTVTEAVYRMLFPNGHGIHFTGGIHEQFAAADPDVTLVSQVIDVYMHHYGYLNEVMEKKNKVEVYGTLTETELNNNPDDFLTHYHAAGYFITSADWERAEEEMQWCRDRIREDRAEVSHPQKWLGLVLAQLAGIHARTDRHSSAVAYAREGLSIDADNIEGQYWLGRCLSALDDLDEASEVLYRLIYEGSARPTSPLIHQWSMQSWLARKQLGQNELKRGNYADAWRELELGVLENPKDTESWILLSIAACALQEFDRAVEVFGVAITLENPSPQVFQAYEALRLEATDPRPIEAVLREALKKWPESFVLMHILQDLLKAMVAIEQADVDERASGPLGDTMAIVDRIVGIWPRWGRAKEVQGRVAA